MGSPTPSTAPAAEPSSPSTASLGNLPVELIDQIIYLLRPVPRFREIVKLRNLNIMFADRIMYALSREEFLIPDNDMGLRVITQTQTIKELAIGSRKHESTVHFLARYLVRRPLDQSSWNANISSVLNHLLDALLPADADLDQRFDALVKLCRQIDQRAANEDGTILWRESRKDRRGASIVDVPARKLPTEQPWEVHLLVAALVLGLPAKYEPLVREAQAEDPRKLNSIAMDSEYFGTPLFAAATARQRGAVAFLLDHGCNIADNACKLHVLGPAVRQGDRQTIRQLLDNLRGLPAEDPDPFPVVWPDGQDSVEKKIEVAIQEPLIQAIQMKHSSVAWDILQHDIVRGRIFPRLYGWGLHWAIRNSLFSIAQVILLRGGELCHCHPYVQSARGLKLLPPPEERRPGPLSVAAWLGDVRIIKIIIKSNPPLWSMPSPAAHAEYGIVGGLYEALLAALTTDKLDALEELLPLRVHIFLPPSARERLIVHAMAFGSAKCALRLVQDPAIYDGISRMQLHDLAKPHFHDRPVALPPPEAGSYPAPALLHMACRLGCVPVAKYLLEQGVSATTSAFSSEFANPMEATLTGPFDTMPQLEALLVSHGAAPAPAADAPQRKQIRRAFGIPNSSYHLPGRLRSPMPMHLFVKPLGNLFAPAARGASSLVHPHYLTWDGLPLANGTWTPRGERRSVWGPGGSSLEVQ